MARKHVKTEPARWYYHCDKLGLLVWQDMPSGDEYIRPDAPDITRTAESEQIFRKEWTAIIESLKNHPSIVCWVPFNEGWGQFKTNDYLAYTKKLDPTRLVDGPSGWTDRGEGDMHDMHNYPGPGMFPVESDRASVLGEFGGLGLARRRAPVEEPEQLGLSHVSDSGRADPSVQEPDRAVTAVDFEGARRSRLHADDRRRSRGQRPHDL